MAVGSSLVSLEVQITPNQGEISLGESKFFMCEVLGNARHIDWFGPNGDRIEPNRPDITVTRNDESSSTLTLYKAGTENAGTYKCVATSGDQQAEATVKVKIFQKITFMNAPSPQEFTEGDNANIICDVTSSPPPTVLWRYKGARIQMEKDVRFKVLNNNHLQIRGIKKTDEGSYTCEGRLMARGEIDLRVIKVVVNVLPTIRVWQSEVNATAEVGQPAMLTCAVDGYPEPMVTWTRNEAVLEAGEKYSFNEDGSEMTIMDVAKLDEGEYTCTAKNKAGESEQELSLRVFVKPKITYIVNQTTSELEEQVTLTCEASGDPTPTINWSYGGRVFTEGEQAHLNRIYQASWTRPEQHKSQDGNVVVRSDARVSSLTLKYVKYTDAGQYLCTARSAIGEDEQTAFLEVRYTPKIHGAVAVYTWERNAVNISCEVKAHPSDVSIVWLRDGQQLPNSNTTNMKIFRTPSSSYLQITPESENDFGSYNCTASNEMGTESKEFLLIQAEVPSAPSIYEVRPFSTTAQIQFEEPESTGGVPVLKYKVEWKPQERGSWVHKVYEVTDGSIGEMTITGLRPETSYQVKMSAINGKGEGESSTSQFFKTEPVHDISHLFTEDTDGNPNPPKLEGVLQPKGNSLKISWIKQDDGGSPILHYLVRYKPLQDSEWKPEIRLPASSEYVILSGLQWDTDYNVYVVAENQKGKSQPASMSFRTSSEPEAFPDLGDEAALSMGIMLWAGILVVVFVLLLLAVDVTCYFVNKCGLIMCLCGKTGTGTKGHNLEEGKAAFIKDESKEPIVEVRTEDECTANHNAAGPTEPNETTPLTEPELAAFTAALALDTLSSVATNSDTATATVQDSPSSETTTLTCSLSTPANDPPDPSPTPVPAPAPTPESNTAPQTPLFSTSAVEAKMAPLVEQRGSSTPEEKETITTPPCTPERTKAQKSGTPIPPKRRHSPKLAALNAKASPPVSPLATSSPSFAPTFDTKKPAPSPPVSQRNTQPYTVALDTDTPAQTASTLEKTAPPNPEKYSNTAAPDASSGSLNTSDSKSKCTDQNVDKNMITAKDAVASSPSVMHHAGHSAPLVADIPSPLPVTPITSNFSSTSREAPVSNDLFIMPSNVYDLLTPDVGPESADLELELRNGADRSSAPPADLISLDSPPSLANGDGADPPSGPVLEASETLAKTAPPVNDEKSFADEKSKLDEAELSNALTEITAEHNSVIQTKSAESKA
ncbi:neural cell adhesion molecule 1b isoform X3 [Cheilinus undulatus]|uniref:neural cell adhesion molecule 1b isoform X3 n=1 Tax=Cheilinus undulatus TaxID=241271 RepID=UPI001BD6706A|nr:neural cell adhesion molecule 1b isoform X3 [Cheilinus undulatus]XP_041669385.1 neural cell adhesion molecule 1b isoform X3 [Cheilinus undulatus]XP_041669392.1 neural cell adhesion molecule 1b isoform X3 [Cheilinus undulatus]